ncbi:MAG: DUF3192 domain-containing protein [Lentisphaeria bacterium]|nr:DUF3192 domain-containing protein [Lentisphaeria bacterium]MBR7120044.1 DUF3192 domain-containing protein [Lentisphaeria bacterium]
MKKFTLLFSTFFALLLLVGCTAARNIENSKKLRAGMTKNQVLAIMGRPIEDEAYCKPDVWFYHVETIWADGLDTRDECMPLVFENGKLVGWGNNFYTRYSTRGVRNASEIKAAPETLKTN